jgi:hypothetical protein
MPEGLSPELYAQLQDAMAQYQAGPQAQQDVAAVSSPGSAVQASIPMPGQLQPPQPAAPNPIGGQPYGGGTPDQQLSSNPKEATADTLNIIERQKDSDQQQGDVESAGLQKQSDIENAASNETAQQSRDFDQLQQQNQADADAQHQRRLQALDQFKAQNLKDPSSQFWEDKGQGSRITAALGAFASGLGGGLTGQGGNKFLDFLHGEMENNFNAHKENIDNMYKAAVEEGKIEDNVENRNRFRNQAKLASFELQSEHIKHDLNAAIHGSASKVATVTAQKAIAGLDQEGVKARSDYAALLAKQGANGLAAQRARQKEIKDQFFKQVDLHNKDMGENESRQAAIADLQAGGYNDSELAPLMEAQGITANPRTGRYEVPKTNVEGSVEPSHYDDAGNLVIPSKTAQGKRIDPKEQEQMRKDATEKTATVEEIDPATKKPVARKQIFNTKEDAEAYKSVPQAEKLHATMVKAWDEGDAGTYEQARKQFIEMAPKLLGYKRGPSEAQAGGIDKTNADANDRATIAGQLPEMQVANRVPFISAFGPVTQTEQGFYNRNPLGQTNSYAGQAINKLKGVRTTLDDIKKDLQSNITAPPKPAAPTGAEVAKKIGLIPQKK